MSAKKTNWLCGPPPQTCTKKSVFGWSNQGLSGPPIDPILELSAPLPPFPKPDWLYGVAGIQHQFIGGEGGKSTLNPSIGGGHSTWTVPLFPTSVMGGGYPLNPSL